MASPALERLTRVEGFRVFGGDSDMQGRKSDPVTIAQAAERLGHPEPTVRVWASRHHARRLMKTGKTAWFDYNDLSTIEGCLYRGERVPPTPEARDQLRASYRTAA